MTPRILAALQVAVARRARVLHGVGARGHRLAHLRAADARPRSVGRKTAPYKAATGR